MHLFEVMAFDRNRMSRNLAQAIRSCGYDSVSRKLYGYFSCAGMSVGFRDRLIAEALLARASGAFRGDTCDRFEDCLEAWLACTQPYSEFRNLTNSQEFLFICYSMYEGQFRLHREQVILESSDGVDFAVDKSVAMARSDFLAGHLRFAPDTQRIRLPTIRSEVLLPVVKYLWILDDLLPPVESFVMPLNPLKVWATEFVKEHRAILPELHTVKFLKSYVLLSNT